MTSLTIRLERDQEAWLRHQARMMKRSKGSIIRELIARQQVRSDSSLAEALADLCGCVSGSKDLSTRPLNYHRSS